MNNNFKRTINVKQGIIKTLFFLTLIFSMSTLAFAAEETCNGIDDDSDGLIDEGLTQVTSCGVGECAGNTGVITCVNGALTQDTCNPAFGATEETCNDLDDDCDGSVDEDLTQSTTCGVGICSGNTGVETCTAGVWGDDTCNPAEGSTQEECNNLDDNCDGTVDDFTYTSSCGVGACSGNTGSMTCTAGAWSDDTCNPFLQSSDETCDDIDNDCDGYIDEELTQSTTCGVGICSENIGFERCTAGVWGDDTCSPVFGAVAESCNNLDDDCDGTIDEDLTQPTACGVGVCSGNTGVKTCSNGDWIGNTCNPVFGAVVESCNNLDDDCDGLVDEDLTQTSTCGVGICSGNTGTETCSNGIWGEDTCDSLFGATVETCNNLDDDCDGQIDDEVIKTTTCDNNLFSGMQTCSNGVWGEDTCDSLQMDPRETIPLILRNDNRQYQKTFEAYGQSMWENSVPPGDSYLNLLPEQSLDGEVGFDESTTFRLPYASDLIESIVDFFGGDFDAEATLGGSLGVDSEGGIGISSKLTDFNDGTVDVKYPQEINVKYPTPNTFRADEIINLDTSALPQNGAYLKSYPSTVDFEMVMDFSLKESLDGRVDYGVGSYSFDETLININEPDITLLHLDEYQGWYSDTSVYPPYQAFPGAPYSPSLGTTSAVCGEVDCIRFLTGATGYLEMPHPMPSTNQLSAQGSLVASDTNTFGSLDINLNKASKIGMLLAIDTRDFIDPNDVYGFQVTSKLLDADIFLTSKIKQDLTFTPTTRIKFEFSENIKHNGQITNEVIILAGSPLNIELLPNQTETITVTPTVLFENEFHNKYVHVDNNIFSVEGGTFALTIPGVPLLPAEISVPDLSDWECAEELCIPGGCLIWPLDDVCWDRSCSCVLWLPKMISVGPYTTPSLELGPVGPSFLETPSYDLQETVANQTFALGGFENKVLPNFELDPQVAPYPVILPSEAELLVIDEGSSLLLDGSESYDVDNDPLRLYWDLDNDGVFEIKSPQASYLGSDDGTYTVSLMANDPYGYRTVQATITVENVIPEVNAGVNQTVDEGDLVEISSLFSDAGWLDTHTATIDWGDGNLIESGNLTEENEYPDSTGTVTGDHAYGDNGIYTVTVTVTDDDGGVGVDTLTVTVNNVVPTVSIDSFTQPNPHFILPIVHDLGFTGSFTDPGWLDTHTLTWSYGDGITLTELFGAGDTFKVATPVNHIYSNPGSYTVTLTVADDDNGIGSDLMSPIIVLSATDALQSLNTYIQGLDESVFKNNAKRRKGALDSMFRAIEGMIENEAYTGAIADLTDNVREKADGFVDGLLGGDWIIDSDAQVDICFMLDDLLDYLRYLEAK